LLCRWAEIATSMGWTVLWLNPGGSKIFCTHPDLPWGLLSLLHNGYRVLPWGKAAGVWRWPPSSFSAEVKGRVELQLYTPVWVFVACFRANFTFTLYSIVEACHNSGRFILHLCASLYRRYIYECKIFSWNCLFVCWLISGLLDWRGYLCQNRIIWVHSVVYWKIDVSDILPSKHNFFFYQV
jgi:hypothetical protein